jgi:tRNA(fMet)-specific endonuclease VapC
MGLTAVFLLDTNVVSELAKRVPAPAVEARVKTHERVCAVAAPTVEELAFGIARLPPSRKRHMLGRWLEGVVARFAVLPYDARAALWLGAERARLAAAGRSAPRADGEIAAVAVVNDLVLVTRDSGDFRNFAGLKVEDWFAG